MYSLFLQFLSAGSSVIACQFNQSKGWERGGVCPFIPWFLWYSSQESNLKWGLLWWGHLPTGSGAAHDVPCKPPGNHLMVMRCHQGPVQIWTCIPEVKGFPTQPSPGPTSIWPFHSLKRKSLLRLCWFYAPHSGITVSTVLAAPLMPSAQM